MTASDRPTPAAAGRALPGAHPAAASPRIGLFLLGGRFPDHHATNEQALAALPHYAITAEEHGFDDVFVAEHHFMPYGTCPSAITMAATLLGATNRIGVGTAVSVLSTTHPVALAEQAATLAVLHPGRFTLGVGRGGPWVDLEVFGTGAAAQGEHFPESLTLLTRWLVGGESDGTLGWTGTRHAFRAVPIVPRPPQPPPVLLACTSPNSARLAAKLGLPMLVGMHATDDEKSALIQTHGNPHATHAAVVVAQVADSRQQALATLRAAMPPWLRDGLAAYTRLDGAPYEARDPVAYTEHLLSIHPVGDPDYCVNRLSTSIAATGIRHLLLFVEGAGEPALVTQNITRLGREVLPQLRARFGSD